MRSNLSIDRRELAEFCQRWKIAELSLFGSVLRDDFGPESDVDFLVAFAPGAQWSLFDHVAMENELSLIVGRRADLVSRKAIERSRNPDRRREILSSAEPYFVAQ
jgi:predicted nucleotidyltransferase